MMTATLELYNALIEAGAEKEKAEAAKDLATKSDIVRTENRLIMWMAGFHLASLGALAALLTQV